MPLAILAHIYIDKHVFVEKKLSSVMMVILSCRYTKRIYAPQDIIRMLFYDDTFQFIYSCLLRKIIIYKRKSDTINSTRPTMPQSDDSTKQDSLKVRIQNKHMTPENKWNMASSKQEYYHVTQEVHEWSADATCSYRVCILFRCNIVIYVSSRTIRCENTPI